MLGCHLFIPGILRDTVLNCYYDIALVTVIIPIAYRTKKFKIHFGGNI